jgi:hypothetical protein
LTCSFTQSAHQRDAEERQCGEDGTYGQVLGFVAGAGSGHVRPPLASTGWQTDHKCQQRYQLMVHRKRNDIWPCNAVYARLQSARKDHRGVGLISDVLPFGRLWYGEPNAVANAVGYAMHRSRSHHAVIRVYDAAGNVIETHEHKGDFNEW